MSLKVQLPLLFALIFTAPLHGQLNSVENIKETVQQSDIEMQIYFLAADEFRGRETGTSELDIAGRYIATTFRSSGVKHLPGYDLYYQPVPLIRTEAPRGGELSAGDSTFVFTEDFIILNSLKGEFSGPLAVMEHGSGSDLEGNEVQGKVVVVRAGAPGQSSPQQWLMNATEKNRGLRDRGAVAVVELYDNVQLPWEMITAYMNQSRLMLDDGIEDEAEELPHLWLNTTGKDLYQALVQMEGEEVRLSVTGEPVNRITSNNVVGYIEGSDPLLKEEYLLLGAHYDHVGVAAGQEEGNYIYNGARDNAVGVSALLQAARYFSAHPPKRSVILAAWTAEEAGLLGSNFFSENPMVPLDRIIFNLNIDGAGYNDTTKVTVIGLERTNAGEDMSEAAAAFGLEAIPDPVPEQNLFDRSDNVNFARNGIPAPTYSLGITAFDDEIGTYYHTVEDEPHTLNYPYITQYIRSFLYAAERIANSEEAPFWQEGDIYEDAGLELYDRDE